MLNVLEDETRTLHLLKAIISDIAEPKNSLLQFLPMEIIQVRENEKSLVDDFYLIVYILFGNNLILRNFVNYLHALIRFLTNQWNS